LDITRVQSTRTEAPIVAVTEATLGVTALGKLSEFIKDKTTVQLLQALRHLYGGGHPPNFPEFAKFFHQITTEIYAANKEIAGKTNTSKELKVPSHALDLTDIVAFNAVGRFYDAARGLLFSELPPDTADKIKTAMVPVHAESNRFAQHSSEFSEVGCDPVFDKAIKCIDLLMEEMQPNILKGFYEINICKFG
jgi:hypothetical protein